MANLLDEILTTDGSTEEIDIKNVARGLANSVFVRVSGTFGGGTITFETGDDGATDYVPVEDSAGTVSLTDQGHVEIFLKAGELNGKGKVTLRATLTGATTPNVRVIINNDN